MRCTLPWHGSMLPWPTGRSSAACDHGTAVHEDAERHASNPSASGDYLAARTDSDAARVAYDELSAGGIALTEQPVGYDPITGSARLIPSSHRDYSLAGPTELAGTADLIVVRPGHVAVYDYKTGRPRGTAATSWQLRLLGLAVARIVGAESVTVALVYIRDGDYRLDEHTFGPWDLDEFAGQLSALVHRMQSGEHVANPGTHCYELFCPVRDRCPETTAAIVRASDRAMVRLPVWDGIKTDEQARSWHIGLKLLEQFIESARADLHDYVRRSPVDLGAGTRLGVVERAGTDKIDLSVPGALRAVVRTAGARAVDRRVTKTSIEAATRAKQERRGEGRKNALSLYAELKRLGAMTTGLPYTRIDEYTVEEDQNGNSQHGDR